MQIFALSVDMILMLEPENYDYKIDFITGTSLDYMYNLSNRLLGVNPYRRFDFSLFAGPMLQLGGMLAGNIEPNWGVNGGGQLAWHANNFVDFFAEPRVTYLVEDKYYSRSACLGCYQRHYLRSRDSSEQLHRRNGYRRCFDTQKVA